jgi:hypothetical protein
MEFAYWLHQPHQVRQQMKLAIALTLCVATSTAVADCYMRSNITLWKQPINAEPTDIQRLVVPDDKGQKCVLRYRLHVGNEWKTVEGTGIGRTETEACAQALQLARGSILEEVEPNRVRADTQMVCSDLPDIRVRPVRKGELIWESEADLHSHALERKQPYFFWKQARCRKFIERTSQDQNLIIYQGVMCQSTTTANSKWLVLDKY